SERPSGAAPGTPGGADGALDEPAARLPQPAVLLELAEDGVEDAVDEGAALLGRERLGHLERLVERDLRRDVPEVEDYGDGHAVVEVAGEGDVVELPVLDVARDEVGGLGAGVERAREQLLGEAEVRRLPGEGGMEERGEDVLGVVAAELGGVEGLEDA